MMATADEEGSTKLKKNHCYMEKDGTLSIVEQVKLMIQTLNYSMHDCQPFIDTLNDTCVAVLTDYNKALDEKNIACRRCSMLEDVWTIRDSKWKCQRRT